MLKVQVGRRVPGVAAIAVEVARVREVPEHALKLLLRRPLADLVARLLANHLEDVGADVPTSKGGEIPVGLDGGNLRVMVVEAVVGGADKVLGNGIADEDGEDVVLDSVGLVLIPGDQDERVVHEVLVLHERPQERTAPSTGDSSRGVVAVGGHVGGDEHPLGQLVCLQILVEHGLLGVNHGEVLDLRQALLRAGHLVNQDGGVVLSNVVVGSVLLVHPAEALVPRVRHVLLVHAPGDATVLEQVNDGGDVGIGAIEGIVLHAKVVTGNGG